ncbi:MAG: DUF503 domain-containing protein, partial [Candidatus Aureabacteria bacterium]|nr:DUF503 domain-containing protein [Candidatus Auribacterota bacterium]
MFIGVLQVSFDIPDSFSIKDKRSALSSLKKRLQSTFNVSVAETEQMDSMTVGFLAVAFVASDKKYAYRTMSKILAFLEREKRIVVRDV